MFEANIKDLLNTIQEGTNPEIHHFRNGTHPGKKYYIKTIIPGPKILNDDTYVFWQFWETLADRYSKVVKLIDHAVDWHGHKIPFWYTIWLEERIDILWSWNRIDGINFQLIDYDIGLKYSGIKAIELIKNNIDRLSPEDIICLNQLEQIAEFLLTYTSDKMAEQNRKKFIVIENEHIFNQTGNK